MTTDRAVSVPVQFVLLLATLALLSSGLFVGVGNFVQDEQSAAAKSALETVGNRLAVELAAADRLANPLDGDGNLTLGIDTPARLAGTTYTITIEDRPGNRSRLVLETVRPTVAVDVMVVTDVQLVEGSVSGGPLELVYDPDTDTLEVNDG